jgi:hypothetical protein
MHGQSVCLRKDAENAVSVFVLAYLIEESRFSGSALKTPSTLEIDLQSVLQKSEKEKTKIKWAHLLKRDKMRRFCSRSSTR